MNVQDVHKFIKTHLLALTQKYDFEYTCSNQNKQGSGILVKKSKEVIFKFGYGVHDMGNELEIGGGYSRITFPKVEEITLPILIANNILGESAIIDPTTFVPINQELIPIAKISKEKELLDFINILKNVFEKNALPLFEEFCELKKINNILNNIPQKEISNYIPKGVYKKATIWKLCNNPKYDEYINWLYTGMTKRAKNYPDNIDHQNTANAVRDLKERLKSLA